MWKKRLEYIKKTRDPWQYQGALKVLFDLFGGKEPHEHHTRYDKYLVWIARESLDGLKAQHVNPIINWIEKNKLDINQYCFLSIKTYTNILDDSK